MRLPVLVVFLGAAMLLGWRMWKETHRPGPTVSAPVLRPSTAIPPEPVRPGVPVRTQLDPEDPELRAAVERLGEAVEPAIDSLAVPTVDAAMAEHARTGDLGELQARLDRILATNPAEAGRLHACFLAAKGDELLFVLAKIAAGGIEGEGFAPWIETAESGTGDHRRFAMYALAGDDGARSLDVLTKAWGDPSAGAARAAAGFVLEGRVEELSESGRESVRLVCREELRRAADPEMRAEAIALLASPSLPEGDRAAVVEALVGDRDESVRLAALQALALGDTLADPAVVEALERILADDSAPARLRAAVEAVLSATLRRR